MATARQRIEAILESITDGFLAIDRNWRFTYVNQKAAEYLGRSHEELIGKKLSEGLSEAWVGSLERQARRVLEENTCVQFEEYRSQTDRWLETIMYPTDEGLSAYSHDITDRKRAEQALRESEARFSAIISIAADAIISVDKEQRIILFNRGAGNAGLIRPPLCRVLCPPSEVDLTME